jgi:hypothetical protein
MISNHNNLKLTSLSTFILITILYLITRIILFKGFNGTDDLHYAMLSSKMINGSYSAFNRFDIFSGRVLLIFWQAFIYKLFGITVFSTQIGTISITVIACYLTIYYVIKPDNKTVLSVLTAVFYFNPVTIFSTIGILPDAYVMLTCVILLMLIKKISTTETSVKAKYLNCLLIAAVIISSLFIKEITILFLPWLCVYLMLKIKPKGFSLSIFVFCVCLLGIIIIGLAYFAKTGEFFFKISQIKNSENFPKSSHPLPPIRYIFWLNLLIAGFYPVVFGLGIILTQIFKKNISGLLNNEIDISFFMLLVVAYFFQLTFASNNPLIPDPRQFLFLLPIAIAYLYPYIRNILFGNMSVSVLVLSFSLMVICILNTGNKWQWMVYTLIFLLLFAKYSIRNLKPIFLAAAFIFILWLSVLEPLYLSKSNWFKNLSQLNKTLNSKTYFFPEYDNMTHWSFLHQFDISKGRTYSLDTNTLYLREQYYTTLNEKSFTPGWLIVNEVYTIRSNKFLNTIDSLKKSDYFSNKIREGSIQAYYIDNYSQIQYIRNSIVNEFIGKSEN